MREYRSVHRERHGNGHVAVRTRLAVGAKWAEGSQVGVRAGWHVVTAGQFEGLPMPAGLVMTTQG